MECYFPLMRLCYKKRNELCITVYVGFGMWLEVNCYNFDLVTVGTLRASMCQEGRRKSRKWSGDERMMLRNR